MEREKRKVIINLIEKGHSINSIRELTGLAKSSIYYHYKKLKGKKYKEININFKKEDELGEFLGIFTGDGNFFMGKNCHYRISVYTGYYEKEYSKYLENKMWDWFNKIPQKYIIKSRNKSSAIALWYYSRPLYDLIKRYLEWEGKKTYTIRLKNLNLNNKEFNLGFLRGLIDTDGNYYHPKKRLSFSTTSKELASQAYKIFEHNLDYTPNLNKYKKTGCAELYTITLHGKKAKEAISLLKLKNQSKNAAVV